MNDWLQQVLSMSPGIGAAMSGNGPEAQAFMEGFERARQADELRKRTQQMDALALEDRQFARQDRERQFTRQQTLDAQSLEDRNRRQAFEELQIPGTLAELGSTAETPQDAQALIENALPNLMQVFGQDTMAYGMPAVEMATRTITGRQRKQVRDYIDSALKTSYVADNPEADPELQLPDHLKRILAKPSAKLSELQAFAQLPIGKPAKRPADDVSLQRDTMLVDGVPTVVTFNPKTSEWKDQSGRVVQVAPVPPRQTGGDGGLNANQEALLTERLAKSWNDANASGREMRRQLGLMETGLRRFREGDQNGGSQAVLVTFQKILDPTSVVRESEYARSAQGISMLGRIQGYIDRLEAGGAGVPEPELAAMVETARQMLDEMQTYSSGQRSRIEAVAKKRGIDPVLIFGLEPARSGGSSSLSPMAPASSHGSTRPQSNQPARPGAPKLRERRRFGDVLGEWDGEKWVEVKLQ